MRNFLRYCKVAMPSTKAEKHGAVQKRSVANTSDKVPIVYALSRGLNSRGGPSHMAQVCIVVDNNHVGHVNGRDEKTINSRGGMMPAVLASGRLCEP